MGDSRVTLCPERLLHEHLTDVPCAEIAAGFYHSLHSGYFSLTVTWAQWFVSSQCAVRREHAPRACECGRHTHRSLCHCARGTRRSATVSPLRDVAWHSSALSGARGGRHHYRGLFGARAWHAVRKRAPADPAPRSDPTRRTMRTVASAQQALRRRRAEAH